MERLKQYYQLTKPGIIYGNLMTAAAGFLFGSQFHINWCVFLATLAGTALVIASGCTYNNILDREIDQKMQRTSKRALATGEVSVTQAFIYATVLGIIGFTLLVLWTHPIVVLVGAIALVDYVILYGFAKRHSVHGTLVGSICGAAPLVAGYVAAVNQFDLTALILFGIMVAWQMAHFYAIAMYRASDYKKAGIPVLPVVRGMRAARTQILGYIALFLVLNGLLFMGGAVGYVYVIIMLVVSADWLQRGLKRYKTADDTRWGKQMFFYSLTVLLLFSGALVLSVFLP